MAITILDQYLTTLPAERDASYEESEILMYKLQILEEIGDKQAALDHLDRHFYDILDRNAWLEKKVELLLALGRSDEARQLLTLLIKRNPENYMYHRDLQVSKSLLYSANDFFSPLCKYLKNFKRDPFCHDFLVPFGKYHMSCLCIADSKARS